LPGAPRNEFLIRAVKDIRTEAKRLSYLSYDNVIDPDTPLEIHYESVVGEHDQIIEGLSRTAMQTGSNSSSSTIF
jgi:hypothetical protein